MAFTKLSKPTTTYNSVSKISSYLLINTTDFLLINSTDRLITADDCGCSFTNISKPTTTYSNIVKPT